MASSQNAERLSEWSAEHIFAHAKAKASITKEATFHAMRHSLVPHLLEDGVGMHYIQALLGHDNVETTLRCTHVTQEALGRIERPLDNPQL